MSLNRENILNDLVNALLIEIDRIKSDLKDASGKQQASLRRELRGSSLALASLLQMIPEETSEEEWLKIIQTKAGRSFIKTAQEIVSLKY